MDPQEKKISDTLTVRWGFPDGHGEVVYRPTFIGKFTCILTPQELFLANTCVMAALEHAVGVGKLPGMPAAFKLPEGPPPPCDICGQAIADAPGLDRFVCAVAHVSCAEKLRAGGHGA